MNPVPEPGEPPKTKVMVRGLPGSKFTRQHAPTDAAFEHIKVLQTKGTDWLFRFAMALDRGANLRMAGQLPSPRSGLRDQSAHERGLDQNRHDPHYGTKARLSILRQVLSLRFN
jgi:hypothetical protein